MKDSKTHQEEEEHKWDFFKRNEFDILTEPPPRKLLSTYNQSDHYC